MFIGVLTFTHNFFYSHCYNYHSTKQNKGCRFLHPYSPGYFILILIYLSHHWLSGMNLMYIHDDSENMEDTFTIQLNDGRHQIQQQVAVKILPRNDEEPHVIR